MAITTVSSHVVSVNAIQGTLIADNAITAVHIATNAVSGTLIADNAITAVHVAQNSITVTQLADDCVESDKIADGVITTNHLNKAMISSQTEVTAVAGDFLLIGDTSDSNNLKKIPISGITALVDLSSKLSLSGGTMSGALNMGSQNITAANRISTADGIADTGAAGSVTVFNESGSTADFRIESDSNTHMFFLDGGTNEVRIGTNAAIQSIAHLGVRQNGGAIEFGHENNGAGYFGTVGAFGSNGHPYIGFSTACEASANTFSTFGHLGNIITGDLSGNLKFMQVTSASATGQTPAERMRIDASGNVGIGTSSPAKKLHVAGLANTDGLKLQGNQANVSIVLENDATNGVAWDISSTGGGHGYGDGALHFTVGFGQPKMKIQSDGKVGIGTNTPSSILHIEGNTNEYASSPILYFGSTSTANAAVRDWAIGPADDSYGNFHIFRGTSTGSNPIGGDGRVFTVSSSGNVGIGTPSPAQTLDVSGHAQIGDGGGAVLLNFNATGNAQIKLNSTEMMRITADGVGIGETSPAKLGLTGSSNGKVLHMGGDDCQVRLANSIIHHDNSGNTILHVRNHYGATSSSAELSLEGGYITFNAGTSFTEAMRIVGTSIHIGTTAEANGSTGGCSFSTDTSNRRNFICATTGTGNLELIEFRNPNGTVGDIKSNGSGTSYNTSSDYRLKENVDYTWDATTRLKQLKPARFNFKVDADTTIDGFLAHEVSSIVPIAVSGEKDGEKMQSIDHSKLVPLLVKTIQELEARIATLEG